MSRRMLSIALALILTLGTISLPAHAGYYENYSHSHRMAMLFHEGYANHNGKIYDYNGNIVRDMGDENTPYSYFSEGLIVFQSKVNGQIKHGYRDKNWNIVIEPKFDRAYPFSDGLALVYNENSYTDDFGNRWDAYGYIDKTGKIALPFRYMRGDGVGDGHFREGYAGVFDQEAGKYGYINKSGDIAVAGKFYGVTFFSEGLAATTGDTDIDGYIDKSGRFAVAVDAYEYKPFCEGLAAVQDRATWKWGYVDKTGKMVIAPQYADAKNFSEGLAAVSVDGETYGFIDKSGNMAIPARFSGIAAEEMQFHEGLCEAYSTHNKSGYIDKTGKVVIAHQYNDAMPFKEGHALVFTNAGTKVIKNPLGSAAAVTPAAPVTPATPASPQLVAKPTASTVLVNGANAAFDAYNIEGNNYFKLRDLAFVLSGTEKQFEVGFDSASNAILLTSGQPYTIVGGEMERKGAGNKTPKPTSSKIFLDGKSASFTAYNIDGNNYFKLRDIGAALNFGVDWDSARNTIVIDTSKGYTP